MKDGAMNYTFLLHVSEPFQGDRCLSCDVATMPERHIPNAVSQVICTAGVSYL